MNYKFFEQSDRVRVTKVNRQFRPDECIPGTRTPRIGDVATVVETYDDPTPGYELESCNPNGKTLWLASVAGDDLELKKIDD
ncbi:MAG: DUF4926 domain-containing protein [Deltaproteobacteria bacterium]|nr:DUF4926 domain-containing protein [Deltaproteobacteria bacterium]